MPQTLTEIKQLLASHGLRPKHRFGQNFLHDHNQMGKILAAAGVRPGEVVLEVGAGTGALTERLVEAGAEVVAVEIDADLQPILRSRLGDRITLVMGDVLASKRTIEPRVVEALGGRPFKVVANLPYHVASPLLADLAADHPAMRLAIVMVQREVADRLAAPPGGKDFGPLSVIVQAMCEVDRVATLSPGCFWPQPTIDSAVVRLVRRETPLTDDPHALAAAAQHLFHQRRKQLRATLKSLGLTDADLPPGVLPTMRPAELTVPQIAALAARLSLDAPNSELTP